MLVSLYTVRVVLNTLGAEDYGIYNVVAGVVTMFGFLSSSMAMGSRRHLAFELGKGDYDQLEKVFSLDLIIYILLGLIIIILGETLGLWFVNNKLVVPDTRINASRWIYQFSIISFFLQLMTTPYMAAVTAHEDMNIYAYLSIMEVILKLVIVFILRVLNADKLIVYGFLTLTVTFINTGIYRFVCVKKYRECKFKLYWDFHLFKELFSYTGFIIFGQIAVVIRHQGIDILLNMFFGPVVNAARAVAKQVNNAVFSFANNISNAVHPQVIKSYAEGKQPQMIMLVFRSSKIMFFLSLFFILPLQLELPFALQVWLKNIPEYFLIFTRIILIEALIESLAHPLSWIFHATGKIKLDQIMESGIILLNLPVSFILLKNGASAINVLIVGLILLLFSFFTRILLMSLCFHISFIQYFKNVLIPIIFVAAMGSIAPVLYVNLNPYSSIMRFLFTVIISSISFGLMVFVIGLSPEERSGLVKIGKRLINSANKMMAMLRKDVSKKHWII
jgi:O-antigen/teichoic acid export membrane protein